MNYLERKKERKNERKLVLGSHIIRTLCTYMFECIHFDLAHRKVLVS